MTMTVTSYAHNCSAQLDARSALDGQNWLLANNSIQARRNVVKAMQIRWMSVALAVVCLAVALPQFVAGDRSHLMADVVFLCGAALYVCHALRRPTDGDAGTSKVQIFVDDSRITARYANGERRSVTWDALVRVGITTTDEGPAVDDVFWGLHSQERVEIVYPSETIGAQALLDAMQSRLKDFNNEAVIQAMGSTDNDRFVVWQAAAAES